MVSINLPAASFKITQNYKRESHETIMTSLCLRPERVRQVRPLLAETFRSVTLLDLLHQKIKLVSEI